MSDKETRNKTLKEVSEREDRRGVFIIRGHKVETRNMNWSRSTLFYYLIITKFRKIEFLTLQFQKKSKQIQGSIQEYKGRRIICRGILVIRLFVESKIIKKKYFGCRGNPPTPPHPNHFGYSNSNVTRHFHGTVRSDPLCGSKFVFVFWM